MEIVFETVGSNEDTFTSPPLEALSTEIFITPGVPCADERPLQILELSLLWQYSNVPLMPISFTLVFVVIRKQ